MTSKNTKSISKTKVKSVKNKKKEEINTNTSKNIEENVEKDTKNKKNTTLKNTDKTSKSNATKTTKRKYTRRKNVKTTSKTSSKKSNNTQNTSTKDTTSKRKYTKKSNIENIITYQKIPNKLLSILNIGNKRYEELLLIYITILMNSNINYNVKMSVESIAQLCANSVYVTKAEKEKYKEQLLLLNNDIYIAKNSIEKMYLSRLLDIQIYMKYQKDDDTNDIDVNDAHVLDILNITLENPSANITDNYTEIYYKEYEYLLNILFDYKKNHRKKINGAILFLIYFSLKNLNKIDQMIKQAQGIYDRKFNHVSRKTLTDRTNVPEGTIDNYIKILESYGLLEIKKGNYSNKKANEYKILKPWDT